MIECRNVYVNFRRRRVDANVTRAAPSRAGTKLSCVIRDRLSVVRSVRPSLESVGSVGGRRAGLAAEGRAPRRCPRLLRLAAFGANERPSRSRTAQDHLPLEKIRSFRERLHISPKWEPTQTFYSQRRSRTATFWFKLNVLHTIMQFVHRALLISAVCSHATSCNLCDYLPW